MIVLPNAMKGAYPAIKRQLLCKENLNSQVVLESTLNRGSLQSIITKLVIQMSSKSGNVPWNPALPDAIKDTMLIGLDQVRQGKKYQLAIVSTINRDFSRYHSTSCLCESAIIGNIDELIMKAVESYYLENKKIPLELVILRSGMFRDDIVEEEIKKCKGAIAKLNEISGTKPNLIYLTLDRRPGELFFAKENDVLVNPPPGSVVSKGMFGNNVVYMIPQRVNRGSAKPVIYNIRCYESKINGNAFIEMLLEQCYNYVNWMGPVRVPSVVMYASRLAKLTRECLHDSLTKPLQSKLCYI